MIYTENYIKEFEFPLDYGQKALQEGIYNLQQTPSSREFYESSAFCPNYLGVHSMISKKDLMKFDEYLLLNKGLGEITRQGHLTSMNIVLKKIKKCKPKHSELQKHILWMHSKRYSHSHITNTSKAIEYYTEFIGNPLSIAKTRKPKKLIKDCLTEAEVNTMIRNTKDIREKALLSLLAFSGIRNKEFCNLKVEDVDFGSNQIIIKNGKYSKDRRANIGSACTGILIEYIMEHKKQKGEFLFTTIQKNNQYQTGDLRKRVKVIAKRAKIEKRVYPHLFRHSLATNLLKRGANLITIKEQLGHNFIESTMKYLSIFSNRIKSEYEFYLPAYT